MPLISTDEPLLDRYCATSLLPTAPGIAAPPAFCATLPLPLPLLLPLPLPFLDFLSLLSGFTSFSSFLVGFFTSDKGLGGGRLPNFFSAAFPSASSLAASSAVMSGGNSTILPSVVRYMRFPPSLASRRCTAGVSKTAPLPVCCMT